MVLSRQRNSFLHVPYHHVITLLFLLHEGLVARVDVIALVVDVGSFRVVVRDLAETLRLHGQRVVALSVHLEDFAHLGWSGSNRVDASA
jgi:hypothetical protein